jgi:hypothetical protein
VARLDRREEIIGGIVHAGDDLGVSLRIGCPEDDEVVEIVRGLEAADVGPEVLKVSLLA